MKLLKAKSTRLKTIEPTMRYVTFLNPSISKKFFVPKAFMVKVKPTKPLMVPAKASPAAPMGVISVSAKMM